MVKNMGSYDRFLLSESPTTPDGDGPPAPLDDNSRNIWKNWADGVRTASAAASEDENENDKNDHHHPENNDNTLLSSASTPTPTTAAKFTEADVHRFLLQLPPPVLDKVKWHLLTSVHFKDIDFTDIEPSSSPYATSRQGQEQGHGYLPPDASGFVDNGSGPGSGSGPGPGPAAGSAAALGGPSTGISSNFRAGAAAAATAAELSAPSASSTFPPHAQRPFAGIETSSPLSLALSARFFGPQPPSSPLPWNHTTHTRCSSPSTSTPEENTNTATGSGVTPAVTTTMAAESESEPLLLRRRGRRQGRIPSLGVDPLALHDNRYLAVGLLPPGPLRASGSGPGATTNNSGPPFDSPPPPPLLPDNRNPFHVNEESDHGDPQQPQELEADIPTSAPAAAAAAAVDRGNLLPQKPLPTAASSRLSLFSADTDTSGTRGKGGHGHPPGGTPPSLGFGFGGNLWDESRGRDGDGDVNEMPGKKDGDNSSDATGSCCTVILDDDDDDDDDDEGPISRVLEPDNELGQRQSIGDGEHLPAPGLAPAPSSGAASITIRCGSSSSSRSSMPQRRPFSWGNLATRHSHYSRCRSRSRSRSRTRYSNNMGSEAAGTTQTQGLVGFGLCRSLIGGAPNLAHTEEGRERDGDGVVDVLQDRYPSFVDGGAAASDPVTGGRPAGDFLGLPLPQGTIDSTDIRLPPSNVDTKQTANGDDGDGDGNVSSSHYGAVDEQGEPINANDTAASPPTRVETQHQNAIGQWVGKVHGLVERTRELWNGLLEVQSDLEDMSLEMERVKMNLA